MIRKWYFTTNEAGLGIFDLIRVALESCRANTNLKPICIYTGKPNSRLEWLDNAGVSVVHHTLSFDDELRSAYGEEYDRFSGHWLRTEIPLIEEDDEIVLYTDFDVMFLAQPRCDIAVPLLGACAEIETKPSMLINSGVLVMNTPALREQWETQRAQLIAILREQEFGEAHDQLFYSRAFGSSATRLPLELNWRPFLGENSEAQIIHFQGTKGDLVHRAWLEDPSRLLDDPFYRRAPEAYRTYSGKFVNFLRESKRKGPPLAEMPRESERR